MSKYFDELVEIDRSIDKEIHSSGCTLVSESVGLGETNYDKALEMFSK